MRTAGFKNPSFTPESSGRCWDHHQRFQVSNAYYTFFKIEIIDGFEVRRVFRSNTHQIRSQSVIKARKDADLERERILASRKEGIDETERLFQDIGDDGELMDQSDVEMETE